jgi:hypothetical protein
MKKILLMLVMLAYNSFVHAQTPTKIPEPAATATTTVKTEAKAAVTKTKQVANPAAYACMKCFAIEKAEGKCSKCQSDKVQLGTYFCEHCMKASGAKPGKCAMCSMQTTQMTRKFCNSKTDKTLKKAA